MRQAYRLTLPTTTLSLGPTTRIMGILNVTPDSFSDGGKYLTAELAIERALAMEAEGADIIDIGGESSRPGAQPISVELEIARVLPVIEALQKRLRIPISIDTYKAPVAAAALAAGAVIVNDISGLKFDPTLAKVVAAHNAALCLMHTRARPEIMQELPPSADIWQEIIRDLNFAVAEAKKENIPDESLIIDPGIGFGKTLEDNLAIIGQLSRLSNLKLPILIGTSRKSFIGKLLGQQADARLLGSLATLAAAILQGAHIVRVHDVAVTREVVRVMDAILARQ